MSKIGKKLPTTLVLVISKSGGTPETRNGMIEAQLEFKKAGLDFSKHAIAVTGEGSKLHQISQQENWLEFFPMWDWVGGRTSETAAVGLLPAALQGFDIDLLLKGAARMDELTRGTDTPKTRCYACFKLVFFDRWQRIQRYGDSTLQGQTGTFRQVFTATHHGVTW